MPEPYPEFTQAELDYIKATEEMLEISLDSFQKHALIETRRANKDGASFKLGQVPKREF